MLNLILNLNSKMYIKILIGIIHHNKSSFDYPICDINFSLKSTLRKHVQQINENKSQHTCLICGHNYFLKCTLKNHIGSVHENKAQKMLKLVLNLFSKMYIDILIGLIQDNKTSYDCSICDINFSLKCTLRKLVEQIHENKSPHTCLICGHNNNLKLFFENPYWICSSEQDTKNAQFGAKIIF